MEQIFANFSQTGLAECRDRIDLVRSRAELLRGTDKVLATMYLENGNTFRQMAKLAGVHETTIARRVSRVVRRLAEGTYMKCLRNREKFSREELAIAKYYYLLGMSQKKVAAKRGVSYYRVNETVKKIRKVVDSG